MRTWVWAAACCLVFGVSVSADTVVLRDGRRLTGQLVGIRDGVVEVEVQRGFFGRERVRLNQDEVARIDFDEASGGGQSFGSGGSGGGGGRLGSGDGDGRPSGMRERSVTVDASAPWTDTGVMVRSGQTVYVSATGRVRWGPGRQDGPGGEKNSPRNDGRPMPNRPAAALIGRIGDADDYFFIGGDEGAIRVRGNGRLFLGINDDYLPDNSGSFRVTIYH